MVVEGRHFDVVWIVQRPVVTGRTLRLVEVRRRPASASVARRHSAAHPSVTCRVVPRRTAARRADCTRVQPTSAHHHLGPRSTGFRALRGAASVGGRKGKRAVTTVMDDEVEYDGNEDGDCSEAEAERHVQYEFLAVFVSELPGPKPVG